MAQSKRIRSTYNGTLPSPGPYLARVVNVLDTEYMGTLEVSVSRGIPSTTELESFTASVDYVTPFYGVSNVIYEGTDPRNFDDVQKSYGFWMVPPDVGTTVLVIFTEGDPNQGYWLGCIPDAYQNHMIPGIASSQNTYLSPTEELRYKTNNLPAAEFLKRNAKDHVSPNSQLRPIHPFAERLLAQGLLLDDVRGVTSSSARREVPSSVFGVSTPGPIDPKSRKVPYGFQTDKSSKTTIPYSRLGGSQFVMDDGDAKGLNELVRLRTRTGHQILLHNSSDLIYIANSKGTAWIELTSNGKIDVYAEDSVSIHTKADFNFRADRDVNIEAGRNINMRSVKNMEINVGGHYNLLIDDYAMISVKNDKDEVVGKDLKLTVGANLNLVADQNILATSGAGMDLYASGDIKQTTEGTFNVDSLANVVMTAKEIFLNGPTAATADTAQTAKLATPLTINDLPNRSSETGWENGVFYRAESIRSFLQRVPTHEPWDQHENLNPTKFSSSSTDVSLTSNSAIGSTGGSGSGGSGSGSATPANLPAVVPGTCNPVFAKDISANQTGINMIKEACKTVGITDPNAVAAVLGITGGETKWQAIKENFNYSASRLLEVFPGSFNGNLALAQQYASNPSSIPEFVYGPPPIGAAGNQSKSLGNTQPGDGERFVGRGYLQLTGRYNYTLYSKKLYQKSLVNSPTALIDNPDLMLDPKISAYVSALFIADRVKVAQNDPSYFNEAVRKVGYNTPDVYNTKSGFYQCFLLQLQGNATTTGPAESTTDSAGNVTSSTSNPTATST
jgi:putative chitinase